MEKYQIITLPHYRINTLFIIFSIWSFITLCRPQDYLPFLAVLRPTLSLGLITLICYLMNEKSDEKIFGRKPFEQFVLLILIMFFGVPFSLFRSASLNEIFNYASVAIIFFFLFFQIVNHEKKIRRLLFGYCCGATVYGIYVLLFGQLIGNRISFGTMFDSNDISFFIINFIAFNLIFIKKQNSGVVKFICLINIAICSVVILKTGSRGGMVAFVTMFAYLLFAHTKTVSISFIKKAVLLSFVFLSLLTTTTNYERYKTILEVENDYNLTDETGRIAVWKIGIGLMLDNPLTGVGMGRFNEGVGRNREERGLPSARWQAAHNSFVQIGAETGVFGLILFIFMTIRVFNITGQIINTSLSNELVKIAEMTRVGFLGHIVSAMFLSQAYSIYWVFYIVLSARLQLMLEKEQI